MQKVFESVRVEKENAESKSRVNYDCDDVT